MNFAQFVEWVFYGVIGSATVYGVSILAGLKESVSELNKQIAIVIEKTTWHEKWLERHDDEIKSLKD